MECGTVCQPAPAVPVAAEAAAPRLGIGDGRLLSADGYADLLGV
jgi:hypothetical protein